MQLLDGKAIAAELRARVQSAAADFAANAKRPIGLAVVLVGEDPASQIYVRNKHKATEAAGMRGLELRLPASMSQAELEAQLAKLSADETIDGILLQLPLPPGLNADAALAKIDPAKDVDGLTTTSAGLLMLGRPGLRPCTPAGCVILAKRAAPTLAGKHCVVIGRSILVGKPAAALFLAEDCTTTIAHSKTQDLPSLIGQADILVAAIGRPEFVQGEWIKPGAIVLDVGINRTEAGLVGDVAFAAAAQRAASITPVPGGVGPMTIACLLRNAVLAAFTRAGWPPPAAL